MDLFLSNQLENLIDLLAKKLFDSSFHPFSQKMLIVPSEKMKDYISFRLAKQENLGVVAGIKILTLAQATKQLLNASLAPRALPALAQLSLELQHEILHLLHERSKLSEEEKKIFLPLFKYLGVEKEPSHLERRLLFFCDELAQIFMRYATFGGAFLKEWEHCRGWQQSLWHRVFSPDKNWIYLHQALQLAPSSKGQIYLCGFSFLPKIYIRFFQQLNAAMYVLSPCSFFWMDLCSTKEKVYVQRKLQKNRIQEAQIEEFSRYLRSQNAFLANMGKQGREFLKSLDDCDVITHEFYDEINESPSSLLKSVQRDFLMLLNPAEEERNPCSDEDFSIQLHGASSKLREVEILFENIQGILRKHRDDVSPILSKDVLVLAPNIEEYLPYILLVFASLDYRIRDVKKRNQNRFMQGIEHLLSLPKNRFVVSEIGKLLSFPQFLEKFEITEKELRKIKQWISKANVFWGVMAEERLFLLTHSHRDQKILEESSTGTWEHALDRLLFDLVMCPSNNGENQVEYPIPLGMVDFSDAELLGKWMSILYSLNSDLKPIIQQQKLTIQEWVQYFQSLAENYFCLSQEDFSLFKEMHAFAARLHHLQDAVFSFLSAEKILKHFFEQTTSFSSSSNFNAIEFGSLHTGVSIPAKVICLLGMQEGAFPRADHRQSFCELSACENADFAPSKGDQDRYHFLEQLVCAREYFLISYLHISSQDKREQSPCLPVQELFSYLDKGYCFEKKVLPSQKLKKLHPPIPFDKEYFSQGSWVKSVSVSSFEMAKLHYNREKEKAMPFFPEFYHSIDLFSFKGEEPVLWVSLKDLTKLMKNPIEFYCNKVLEIYFREEEDLAEKEFLLSPWKKFSLCRESLRKSSAHLIHASEKKGDLPLGAFKSVAQLKIAEEMEELRNNLHAMQASLDCFFDIELSASCEKASFEGKEKLFLPPLKISLGEQREARVIGMISDVTCEGMLYHSGSQLKDLITFWPQYLAFLSLFPLQTPVGKDVLLTKTGKRMKGYGGDALNALRKLIYYYELCLRNVSPCLREWAPSFLTGTEADLQRNIEQTALGNPHQAKNACMDFLFKRGVFADPCLLFQNWAPYLREAFADFIQWSKAS